jgi:inhibitor of cysteine peptidase
MSDLSLTAADNGKIFEVQQGETIVIHLQENPTTGYRWAIDKVDNKILTLQSTDYSQTPGGGIGGSGERRLTFKVMQPGATDLQLKLWQEWEGEKSVTERFSVTIQAQN